MAKNEQAGGGDGQGEIRRRRINTRAGERGDGGCAHILPAFSGSANFSNRSTDEESLSGFFTRNRACPAGVSKSTSIGGGAAMRREGGRADTDSLRQQRRARLRSRRNHRLRPLCARYSSRDTDTHGCNILWFRITRSSSEDVHRYGSGHGGEADGEDRGGLALLLLLALITAVR